MTSMGLSTSAFVNTFLHKKTLKTIFYNYVGINTNNPVRYIIIYLLVYSIFPSDVKKLIKLNHLHGILKVYIMNPRHSAYCASWIN